MEAGDRTVLNSKLEIGPFTVLDLLKLETWDRTFWTFWNWKLEIGPFGPLETGDRTFWNWKLEIGPFETGSWREFLFAWFLMILVSVFDPSKLQTGEFFVLFLFSLSVVWYGVCVWNFFNCELEIIFFLPWFDLMFVFEPFVMRTGVVPFRALIWS